MLYSTHIEECNTYAQASPENLRRSCLFVLATIQQQLETVPVALAGMEQDGTASIYAWGNKKKGVEWLSSEVCINALYETALAYSSRPERLLDTFLQVPGFALVKAGFMCQIFSGLVGCIDLHNVKMYDISRADIRYEPAKAETQLRKRERYVALCDGLGGAHALWSRWCDYVARIRPANWSDGSEVSQFHVDVITGLETGAIVDLFSDVDYEPAFNRKAGEAPVNDRKLGNFDGIKQAD